MNYKKRYDFTTCYSFRNSYAQNLVIKSLEKIKKISNEDIEINYKNKEKRKMEKFIQNNKFNLIILGIVLAFILLLSCVLISNYNSVIKLEEEINESIGNIEVSQKRRMDLIPNYVDSVQDYKNFEKETLQEITKARSQASDGNVKEAEKTLSVVVEKYPDLKSSDLYKNLQYELATTENDIASYRKIYNEDVKEYNRKIKSFPTNIILNIIGYENKEFEFTKYENNSADPPTNLFE